MLHFASTIGIAKGRFSASRLRADAMALLRSTAENYQKCMARGIVKWFNEKKGFGFIIDPAVRGDVFVHFSAIVTNGWKTLKEGEEVEYELDEHQKGSRARNVVRI